MNYITFSEFVTRVKAIVFPDREAENLVNTHTSYIKDALVNLQTNVPCLRDNNVNFYGKADVQEWCGADFLNINRGVVQAVYVFEPGTDCKRYFFDPKSIGYLEGWMAQNKCVTCGPYDGLDISREPYCDVLSYGDFACDNGYAQADVSSCAFKGSSRYYAIGPNYKLIVAPLFPCGWQLAVHWEGIKRDYGTNDPVPDDHDLISAVAVYLEGQRALRLDKDYALSDRLMHPMNGTFAAHRAAMMIRCTRERRTADRHAAMCGPDVLKPFFYDPMANTETYDGYHF